jgi:phosphatidylserine decarboxylase
MSIVDSLKKAWVPIHSAGYPFILIFAVITMVIGILSTHLYWIGIILTTWCAYFFRDPERVTPVDPNTIFSPADGRISFLGLVDPPPEFTFSPTKPMMRVSVFMNVFNVHVNRSPIKGEITHIHYIKGLFINADLDKASENNERNLLQIKNDKIEIGVVQIAGLIARRILCWSKENDVVHAGERFGLIRFGSRLDVYVNPDLVEPAVLVGQIAIAGETPLFRIKDKVNAL